LAYFVFFEAAHSQKLNSAHHGIFPVYSKGKPFSSAGMMNWFFYYLCLELKLSFFKSILPLPGTTPQGAELQSLFFDGWMNPFSYLWSASELRLMKMKRFNSG